MSKTENLKKKWTEERDTLLDQCKSLTVDLCKMKEIATTRHLALAENKKEVVSY